MVKKLAHFGAKLLKIAKNVAKKYMKNWISSANIITFWKFGAKKVKCFQFFQFFGSPRKNGEDSGFSRGFLKENL